MTNPCGLSMLISLPLTRASVNSAILVFAVSQASLKGAFSSALPSPFANPVKANPPITNVAPNIRTVRVLMIASPSTKQRNGTVGGIVNVFIQQNNS
jgi:hypothetical protein